MIKDFFIKNKELALIFSLAILGLVVSYFYIGYDHRLEKDAITYFEAVKFLQGQALDGPVPMNRVLTTSLFLGLATFFNFFLKDFSLSVSALNIIFYLLFIGVFYLLAKEIYQKSRVAFWGSLLVVSNYYLIDPGNAHLADMGGWFFLFLATYFAVKYTNAADRRFYYLAILASAIGVLYKEYGGLGLVNLFLLLLVSNFSNKQKIKDIILAGCLFLVPFLSYHVFVYFKYHYSYFDWYLAVKSVSFEAGRQSRGIIIIAKILGWVFSLGWLAWLLGIKEEIKAQDKGRWKILIAILPTSLFFIIWPEVAQRLAFILVPWLALVAGFGLSRIKPYWAGVFVAAYVLFNYNIRSLIDIINLPF
ncbi:MAG TPA: glycosyltransferase family 39 protein [Candidatus Portnoybacteria bacterium]|nr:glycosyltransferase family 39 protein [Candidatus Portnoybacteria bacterium]